MSEIDSGADWRPIERLLYAYASIVDQGKWEPMDSVFARDATIGYTSCGHRRCTLAELASPQEPPVHGAAQHQCGYSGAHSSTW